MDCVLGYHMNPMACGIAKFNLILARQTGIPVFNVFDPTASQYRAPLLSIKISEFQEDDVRALDRWLDTIKQRQSVRLFLHTFSGTEIEIKMIRQAELVYCGNTEIIGQLQDIRSDLIEAWCPGTMLDTQLFQPAEISIFSFGMAHKVRAESYSKLRTLLEQTGKSYCVYLSTALHENTSFDDSFMGAFTELQEIFGDRVYFLGYLSDTAVYNYLRQSTFFAAFFENGIRSNNTSVNAAMQEGSVVITNLDCYSPPAFVHCENLLDIRQCQALPTVPEVLQTIGDKAKVTALDVLGWEGLVAKMGQCETTTGT